MMIRFSFLNDHQTFGPWARRVQSQPGWVVRAAALTTVLVVVIPLALLAMAAIFIGAVVFLALGLVATLLGLLGSIFSKGPGSTPMATQGRRNVRVIDP